MPLTPPLVYRLPQSSTLCFSLRHYASLLVSTRPYSTLPVSSLPFSSLYFSALLFSTLRVLLSTLLCSTLLYSSLIALSLSRSLALLSLAGLHLALQPLLMDSATINQLQPRTDWEIIAEVISIPGSSSIPCANKLFGRLSPDLSFIIDQVMSWQRVNGDHILSQITVSACS